MKGPLLGVALAACSAGCVQVSNRHTAEARAAAIAADTGPRDVAARPRVDPPPRDYPGRLRAAIRPNIVYLGDGPGNPAAVVRVVTQPDGAITSADVIEPSGDKEWDEAVRRAVFRTGRIPADDAGKVPPVIIITFRPKP